jgi:spermidine synthase
MVGSLATGVVLLYLLGVTHSNWIAVGLNLTAGALVLLSIRALSFGEEETPVTAKPKKKKPKQKTQADIAAPAEISPRVVLTVIALSGLGALMAEVAWTRTVVLLIGPTTYGFSFVVTAVIAGIALGSAVASRWTAVTERPASLLAWVEIAAGVASLAVIRIVGALPVPVGELIRANADRMAWLLGVELFWILLLLLVPSFFFGAAFPLAVRLVFQSVGEGGSATGRVYAWNTFGAVTGSLVAGFGLLPMMGLEATLYVAAIVHIMAGAAIAIIATKHRRRQFIAAGAVGLSVLAPFVLPHWDHELLSGGMYKYAAYLNEGEVLDFLRRGELIFYREGKVATVSVKQIGSKISLAIDGKVDATNVGDMLTQRLLAHVPLLLHPAPREVCVIGYGSGVTTGSALTHSIDRLDAVEISPEVVAGAGFFVKENRDALQDARLTLHVADGRNHLLLADRTYDVIISEPSNPWMAGVSQLFSRDFFQLARTRLATNGLFCQWAHMYNMAKQDLETIVASFTDAFPEAVLFLINEGDVLLVGAAGELPTIEQEALTTRLNERNIAEDLATVEVHNAFTFASLYALSTPALSEWASHAIRHTDDRPVLQFRAPRFMHAQTGESNRASIVEASRQDVTPRWIERLRTNPSADEIASRALMLETSDSFTWALDTYIEAVHIDPHLLAAHEGIVRTAMATDRPQRAEEVLRSFANASGEPFFAEAATALGLLYMNLGRLEEGLMVLGRSLDVDPDNPRALLLASEMAGELGRLDLMEELARRAMAIRPDDGESEALVAEAGLRKGQLEIALSRAQEILERHPQETRALQVVAIAQAQMGDRPAARSAFQKLTELEPDAWLHFNNFAQLEMESNNFKAAAALFERSVDINPKNVQGYVGLRDAARITGDAQQLERASSMLKVLGVP